MKIKCDKKPVRTKPYSGYDNSWLVYTNTGIVRFRLKKEALNFIKNNR